MSEINDFNSKKILMGESLPLDSMLQVGSHYYTQYFIKEGFTVFWVSTRNILGYIEGIFTKKDGYKELLEIWKRKCKWINKNSFAYSFLAFLPFAKRIINPLFKDNLLTNSIHPLKLYEYFAAGLPVVSRDLEEIRKMNSPAFLAKDRETFIKMIVQAYQKGKGKKEYYEFARKNSWDERFKVVKQYVLEHLN